MTRPASVSRPRCTGHVLSVIEFNVEVFIKTIGESLSRWIAAVDILMTDRAHRNIRRRELAEMTSRAGFVTGKARPGRVIRPSMTVITTD